MADRKIFSTKGREGIYVKEQSVEGRNNPVAS